MFLNAMTCGEVWNPVGKFLDPPPKGAEGLADRISWRSTADRRSLPDRYWSSLRAGRELGYVLRSLLASHSMLCRSRTDHRRIEATALPRHQPPEIGVLQLAFEDQVDLAAGISPPTPLQLT